MASPIGFDPTNYTSTVSGLFIPGMLYTDGATGCEYRYVYNYSDGALTAGMACVWISGYAYPAPASCPAVVTYANGGSQASQYASAGICTVSSVPALSGGVFYYFFMLVKGSYSAALDASNGVTAGSLVTGKNVNGNFINRASQVNKEIGYALTSASGGVFRIMATIG